MRIILIGCVKSSEAFLQKLIQMKADIVGVVTRSKSNFNSDFVDLGVICQKQDIDFLYVDQINDSYSKEYIAGKKADLILCLGWSQLLDNEILSMPRLGCIGFHPANLPYNRGRHPLIWALALGLTQTASTLFLLDQTADTGKVISQELIEITYLDDAATLYEKVMKVAVLQLEQVLNDFDKGNVSYLQSEMDVGNVWRKRGRADGEIDWRMSGRGIYNLVRALTKPYVGAHFVYQDKEYKVWKVRELIDDRYINLEPGKVVRVMSCNHFAVKAGDHLIEVLDCDSINLEVGMYL